MDKKTSLLRIVETTNIMIIRSTPHTLHLQVVVVEVDEVVELPHVLSPILSVPTMYEHSKLALFVSEEISDLHVRYLPEEMEQAYFL